MLRIFGCFLLIILFYIPSFGIQTKVSAFNLPLNTAVSFSGGFGELRKNHFHTGLDFRTNGQIGMPVYAVKEGKAARVSVSPTGYGRALYIIHPDGNTSVYGHLSRFNPTIELYVIQQQYKLHQFAVDLLLPEGLMDFKKGDLVAWSGNSGSSGGPHLHFEIRDSKSEKPQNPLRFLPGIVDKSSPRVNSIYLYALNNQSYVGNRLKKIRLETISAQKKSKIKSQQIIEVFGEIGIGIQCDDDFNGVGMKCGVFSVDLFMDHLPAFSFKMDELSFDQGRFVNSHIDYEEMIKNKRWIHRLYLQPGNFLNIYQTKSVAGILKIIDGKLHDIQINVADAFGNTNNCQFKLMSKKVGLTTFEPPFSKLFLYDSPNEFKNDELKIELPKGALYDHLKFEYGSKNPTGRYLSKIHQIHHPEVPVHIPYFLTIKTVPILEKLKSKALIVLVDTKGGLSPIGGNYSEGWISATPRLFGNFAVVLDTIPPTIRMISVPGIKGGKKQTRFEFKIADNLSGIMDYEGLIDGQWALFEYDAKTGTLIYSIDHSRISPKAIHSLQLTVQDQRKNASVYQAFFKL